MAQRTDVPTITTLEDIVYTFGRAFRIHQKSHSRTPPKNSYRATLDSAHSELEEQLGSPKFNAAIYDV